LIEQEIDSIERQIFLRKLTRGEILRLHRSRSRLSVVKRLMLHTSMVIQTLGTLLPGLDRAALQDLRENAEAHFRIADELVEDAHNLMQLQLSLASQRTNEVMRFLTVVSLFFLPLTFIVGVYGMNFKFMPELEEKWGYPGVWALMIGVSLFIFVRVRRSGWLSPE
jgi:magnesium transporter